MDALEMNISRRALHENGSSSSRHDANAKRARVDKVVSDTKKADARPSYDNETLIEVNREAQQANAFLTKELERYKEKEKDFTKDTTNEYEYCKKIKLINEEISNLKSQACQKEKSFHKENEMYAQYVQLLLKRKNELEKTNQEFLKQINDLNNKLRKIGQTAQTFHMLLSKEDNVSTGNIDKMGKDLPSDNKIISEEELTCEAEKHLKEKELILLIVKAADLEISMHGDYYGMLQFVHCSLIDQGVRSTSAIRACALRYFDLEEMELENFQNNALAKLPMLKLGEYEMWEIRKVSCTFRSKICVMGELAFLTLQCKQYYNFNYVNPEVSTGNTKVNTASTETSTASFSDATNVSTAIKWDILPENADTRSNEKKLGIRWCGFDWSDMAEEQFRANMALMAFSDSEVTNDKSCSKSCLQNYEALKKQYDDLLVKLDDTGFKASTYKRGLSILEGQILKYKESEVLFSEEIALLKRSVGHKEYLMGLLRTELEKVKEEKEGFEFKIAKFEKSSKDLDQLLASQITDKSKKGFGYNVVPSPHPLILNRPTPLDLSYSGLEEFKQPEVNEYGPRDSSVKPTTGCDKESDNSKENTDDSLKQQQKTDSSSVKSPLKVDKDWKEKFFCPANQVREEEPKKARENNDAPIIEDWVSDDEDEVEPIPKVEKKTVIPTATKKEFVKTETPVRRSVRYAEMYRSQRPRGNQRNWNGQKSNQLGCNFVFNNKACFICGSFDHIQYSCPNVHKQMVPRAVLMKTGLKTVNIARPVNTVRSVNTGRPFSTASSFNTVRPSYTAHPKSTVHCARPRTYFQNQAQSTVQRPFYKRTALKRSHNQNVNTGRQTVNTGRQNVNTVREREFNAVKPSACWVWKHIKPNGASLSNSQLNDKGFVDSGCSRHMSGNIAHLSYFKDFDGGYVTFGGGANGGRITGKGTIKTDKLDFDDVYFVKEL
ncbi:hypothetical protein Tco_0023991 [Tanacetum coccineum]